ncbi:hypothetical protein NDU88_000681 [Pleurodeles waltl]|uniref:Uncharacterized protein n=1 Tax=Pleurodeles waltl TaxID=8319 RepID=A0AAV7S6T2_PLEWA|nr:hypothetical protein NDU88_000681 [Pleurodeles waltl]
MSRGSGFAPRWARVSLSPWIKLRERGPSRSRRLYIAPLHFLTLVPPYLFASTRHNEVSVAQALCIPGAGQATSPDRGNLHFAARARSGQWRRTVRSLRDPGGSGPKGAAPSASFPLGGTTPDDTQLLQAAGARSPGPRDPGHLQSVPAAESHGPGSSRFSRGNDQPRLPPGAPGGEGTSCRGLGGSGSPCPAVSARESAPQLGASGGSPPRRGPVLGTASLPTLFGTSEPRTWIHGYQEAPRQPSNRSQDIEGSNAVAGTSCYS